MLIFYSNQIYFHIFQTFLCFLNVEQDRPPLTYMSALEHLKVIVMKNFVTLKGQIEVSSLKCHCFRDRLDIGGNCFAWKRLFTLLNSVIRYFMPSKFLLDESLNTEIRVAWLNICHKQIATVSEHYRIELVLFCHNRKILQVFFNIFGFKEISLNRPILTAS